VAVLVLLLVTVSASRSVSATDASGADAVVMPPSGAELQTFAEPTYEGLWLDTGDRSAVATAFESEFAADVPPILWTGNHEICDAGASSAASRLASIRRVNFYRAMAGVPAVITEDLELSAKAQMGAIMMSAEGTLTHNPPSSFACFTETGQQAAANSNLYLGRTGPEAIDGYIEDPGPDNDDVGHRNTILHPPTENMGVGDVAGTEDGYSSNVLWVFDDRVFDEDSPRRPEVREAQRFVAWPPRGYVPAELVHPRWSFMMAGADFSQAEVTVHRSDGVAAGSQVPLQVVKRIGAPGHVPLPTIVWEPEIDAEFETDQTYLVVISGVEPLITPNPVEVSPFDAGTVRPSASEAAPTSYAYTVSILGRTPGPDLMIEDFLAAITVS